MKRTNRLGLDVGSTTVKLVVLSDDGDVLFGAYRRHFSDVRGVLGQLFEEAAKALPGMAVISAVTGSAGLSVASLLGQSFIQEVVAGTKAVRTYLPQADVALELGGEDAKITYLTGAVEQRMNGSCAGGTGAFIDQMATLLGTDPTGLNRLAARHTTIYPIAARCGVFSKTDIQPLLNEGAPHADLAASIFQAVVNQTIGGLACGRPICGNVAFLGGPLHYLDQLRQRFIETLKLPQSAVLVPENGHLFVALGAAWMAEGQPVSLGQLAARLKSAAALPNETRRLPALFQNALEYKRFCTRHSSKDAACKPLAQHTGPTYLGIDAGSTTFKAVLLDGEGNILYSHYAGNRGNPVAAALGILHELYQQLPTGAYIARGCTTGYGEGLLKAALQLDMGEIETIAHYRAARHFDPEVTFILDIGGQDMKCMALKDGVIDGIMLNEACSSGCGSFIDTFAQSLGMDAPAFAAQAVRAKSPVDLGTRCTVFMNSKVKQAQKEGAQVGDISAGLAYSVVKNALYKVIKVQDTAALGAHVVVQGGTFQNDAILRAFELELGREVVRPGIAPLMGAYGAALIARDTAQEGARSTILDAEALMDFTMRSVNQRCQGCSNHCMLTISRFDGQRQYVSGNRCERMGGPVDVAQDVPNLYAYKYERTFDYTSLPLQEAPRGEIGMVRALNTYENYPFWHTLLTQLGFRVVLSGRSDKTLYQKGMDTIPSESVCYPAKLAHGHIVDLLEQGVRTIFYPCIPYEQKEVKGSRDCYNCPIVTSYPEVLGNNMDALQKEGVTFLHPFFALNHPDKLARRVQEEFAAFGVTRSQARRAVRAAYAQQARFKEDVRAKGKEALEWMRKNHRTGVVLAGRPYHVDPEVNHGIPETIAGYGLAVLSEDSVSQKGALERPVLVVDQWTYHTRLYEAAAFVAKTPELELVQLNSFGCGLDAITTTQVSDILAKAGKLYTAIKIDEINNLGAARIRLRSLVAALREKQPVAAADTRASVWQPSTLPKSLKGEHTLVAPQMAPLHFGFLEEAFAASGYNFVLLDDATQADVDVGLKYVHNDACYPCILVVGQLVGAFLSGRFDPDNTTVLITQTGGGCRATNYIAFLRRALKEAGYGQVPVCSLSFVGGDANSFKLTLPLLHRAALAITLADLLMSLTLRTRPYEVQPGQTDALHEEWCRRIRAIVRKGKLFSQRTAAREMVREFAAVPILEDMKKPRVGIVGEILVKFHPFANNNAAAIVEAQGAECVVPGLIDFFLYGFYNAGTKAKRLGTSRLSAWGGKWGIRLVDAIRRPATKALCACKRFHPPVSIRELAKKASKVLSTSNTTGEGWLLTAEMIELIEQGAPNILCVQPFACLPNHVTGKGQLREIRRQYPQANIVPVDYDPGASEVNQLNRIKLMLYTAFENMQPLAQVMEAEASEFPAAQPTQSAQQGAV